MLHPFHRGHWVQGIKQLQAIESRDLHSKTPRTIIQCIFYCLFLVRIKFVVRTTLVAFFGTCDSLVNKLLQYRTCILHECVNELVEGAFEVDELHEPAVVVV